MDELLSEITPLPWRQSKSGLRAIAGEPPAIISDPDIVIVVDADAKTAASTQNWADHYTRTANIRYIVRACNAYPTLRAVVEEFVELFRMADMAPEDECHGLYARALEALGQAKGGA